ncbi:hypothetical protein [Actinoplanes sp. NPDC051851]|uniref:hypothetical protein n=1 Tax=Actinoplanes sp. NPDC051851 TaxID=3154753 RepID=UPI00342D19BC
MRGRSDVVDAVGVTGQPSDPRTLNARVRLAARYCQGGHDRAALLELGERIIAEVHRVLGPERQDLLLVRAVSISSYPAGGRAEEALAVAERYPVPDDEE